MRIPRSLQAVLLSFFLWLLTAAVSAHELPASVSDALRRAHIPPMAIGALVQEVNGGPALLAWNARMPFSPASTMKLLTTDAALELLGPAFRWNTRAYADGPLQDGVLRGNLVIQGSGDPKLVLENFWLFLRRIRAAGVREIRGDLVLDRSAFMDVPYDAAAFDGDPLKPYNAGADALLLNYGALTLRFAPDPANATVQVATDPALDAYPLIPPALADGDCGDWRAGLGVMLDDADGRLIGRFPAACGERYWNVHPYRMTRNRYFELVFRRLWSELGGSFGGRVRDGAVPAGARALAEWQSPPLAEVIRDVNKYSNNVMTRQLLLTLSTVVLKLPATTERGAAVLKTWLGSKGIPAPELVIENGSGLSRLERVSAATMGQLLTAVYRSPLMPEFIASLPLAGQDGTMRRRLTNTGASGQAHIKTGTLDEVRSIAGYALAASGRRYVVVGFINHANAAAGQEALDALLQWVYENG